MSEYFFQVSDDLGFRQGDIIRRFSDPITHQGASWGFVINADCDLDRGKNQGHISWLEIVSVQQYWEKFWAPQQLSKFADKKSRQICDQMNAAIRMKELEVDELTYTHLLKWVRNQKPEEIISSLGVRNPSLVNDLRMFSQATSLRSDESALDLLHACLEASGQNPEKSKQEFRKFITRQDGFPDFFLVPNVPDGNAKGYVVLLRRINGSHESDVFKTEMDARISDRPDALHRVGRFRDGIRYHIVQKMCFLYSRIGSPSEFEADCSQVVEWSIEDLRAKE